MFLFRLMIEEPAVGPGAGASGGNTFDEGRSQAEPPSFWKGRLQDVNAAIASLKRGKSQIIARSPGRRPLYRVAYGPRIDFQRQANYNSAVGAGDAGIMRASRRRGAP